MTNVNYSQTVKGTTQTTETSSLTTDTEDKDNESIDFFESAFDRESRWSRSALYRIDEWSDCELEESSKFSKAESMKSVSMDILDNNVEGDIPEQETGTRSQRNERNYAAGRGNGNGNGTGIPMHFDDQCSVNSSFMDIEENHAGNPRCGVFRNCRLFPSRFFLLGTLLALLCSAIVIGLSYNAVSGDSRDLKKDDVVVNEASASRSRLLEPEPSFQRAEPKQQVDMESVYSSYSTSLQSQVRSSRQTRTRSSSTSNSNSIPTSSSIQNQTVSQGARNSILQTNQNESSTNLNSTGGSSRNLSKKEKQLPPDAASKNPISLLSEMQLRPEFNITHCSLNRRTAVQSFIAYVTLPTRNNITYGPAYGRNKKEAKRRVAAIACKALYNLNYDYMGNGGNNNNRSNSVTADPHHRTHTEVCNSILS